MTNHIPQTFIDELLSRCDLVEVIETYLPLKKRGANYIACCPFHQEKTPSFTVSPTKQFYHCFGCGVSGNAISFLMDYEHLDFIDAIETLAGKAGLEVPYEHQISQEQKSETQQLFDVMTKTARYYQTCLQKHSQAKKAHDYLIKRGLSNEVVQTFAIGFAPPGWNNLSHAIEQSPIQQNLLMKTGMLIQKDRSVYDRFRDRIMFPIRDRRGRVIAFGGRVLNDDTPKYLNSPETTIYHKGSELYGLYEARSAHQKIDKLLVVEGYMDVVALAQHGIQFAIATLGTATTSDHIQRLFRSCPHVIFCFDGDRAGRAAARHALETLLPQLRDDWQAQFMFLPDGEDPDSLVRKEGKENFLARLNEAMSLSDFFFQMFIEQIDLAQTDGRARLVSLMTPLIKAMPDSILREMIIQKLAKYVQMDLNKLTTFIFPNDTSPSPTQSSSHSIKWQMTPIRFALILLLQQPSLIMSIDSPLPDAPTPGLDLLNELIVLLKEHPSLSTGAILEHWHDKPKQAAILAQLASYEHLLQEESIEIEFRAVLDKIRRLALENLIETLMSKASLQGLNEDERKLLQELLKKSKNDN